MIVLHRALHSTKGQNWIFFFKKKLDRKGGLPEGPSSLLVVTITDITYEPGSSHEVAGWAKFQGFTIKYDRLVNVTGPLPCLNLSTRDLTRKCN